MELAADLKSTTPVFRSDIMIEYGSVEIGGNTYICPVRSVSILRARSVIVLTEWDERNPLALIPNIHQPPPSQRHSDANLELPASLSLRRNDR